MYIRTTKNLLFLFSQKANITEATNAIKIVWTKFKRAHAIVIRKLICKPYVSSSLCLNTSHLLEGSIQIFKSFMGTLLGIINLFNLFLKSLLIICVFPFFNIFFSPFLFVFLFKLFILVNFLNVLTFFAVSHLMVGIYVSNWLILRSEIAYNFI